MGQKMQSYREMTAQGNIHSMTQMQGNETVLYQPNGAIHLEVRLAEESVWLTQQQIATLFGV